MTKTIQKHNLENSAEALKALAHPERLAILSLLCKAPKGRLTVKSIYESLEAQQAIVSRHLIILKNAGFVHRMQEGRKTFYGLCKEKKNIQSLMTLVG